MRRRRVILRHEVARRVDVAGRLELGRGLLVGRAVAALEGKRCASPGRHPVIVTRIARIPHRVAPPEVVAVFLGLRGAHVALGPVGSALPQLHAAERRRRLRRRRLGGQDHVGDLHLAQVRRGVPDVAARPGGAGAGDRPRVRDMRHGQRGLRRAVRGGEHAPGRRHVVRRARERHDNVHLPVPRVPLPRRHRRGDGLRGEQVDGRQRGSEQTGNLHCIFLRQLLSRDCLVV